MIELYALLAYFGMMLLPLIVMIIIEHYSSGVIQEKHQKAISRFLHGRKRKFVLHRLRHH